jgi:hypothetical protein
MEGKNLIIAALAGILGVLATMTFQSTPPTVGDSTSEQPASADATSATATSPKRHHHRRRDGAEPTATSSSTQSDPAAAENDLIDPIAAIEAAFPSAFSTAGPDALDVPVRVLIASLPNPTGALAIDFDRGMEAIERAAQSQRYVVQSAWTPWDKAGAAGKPGWFLFRRDGKSSNELLLVLVASEHPTSGVDQTELEGAFNDFLRVAEPSGNASAYAVLPVLGPYYSGSAVSLEQGLRTVCASSKACADRELFAISGSATRRQTQVILQRLDGVFATSGFHATVLPDDLLLLGMQRFIKERLRTEPQDIAELTESSTDYGNAVASAPTAALKLGTRTSPEKGIKIPVPIGLGMLTGDTDAAGRPQRFDKVSAKVNLELQQTFETLRRNGVQHVGILTTTTDDKILLATHFRDVAPNLRLHLYESSIDLADRQPNKPNLDGVMVASSYPLFPATQLWNDDAHGALVEFPSMAAEGIYNATLVLLSRSDEDLAVSLAGRLRDYVSPFCEEPVVGPSAWVSVSIAGQLWPLVAYPASPFQSVSDPLCKTDGLLCRSPPADPYVYTPDLGPFVGKKRPRPGAHVSFLTVLGAVVVLLLIVLNMASFVPFRRTADWRMPLVTFDPTPDEERKGCALPGQGDAHRIATIGILALAITGLVMGKILYLPSWFGHPSTVPSYSEALGALLQLSAVLLVGLTWVIAVLRVSWPSLVTGGSPQDRSHALLGLIVILMVVAMCVFPIRGLTLHPDGHTYFFYVRAMDPSVGLTPTVPLFMVGMAAYVSALVMLSVARRSRDLDKHAVDWATPSGVDPEHSFHSCAQRMTRFAEAASASLIPPVLAGTIVGTAALFLSPLRLGSLEGRDFDLGCSICFSFAYSLALATAWRAGKLWHCLRDFTHALGVHPAAKALERLPKSVAWRFRSPVPGKVGSSEFDVALKIKMHALHLEERPAVSELRTALEPYWFPSQVQSTGPFVCPEPKDSAAAPQPSQSTTRETLQEDILALQMAKVLGIMCDTSRKVLLVATVSGLVALLGGDLYPFQPAATLTAAGLVTVGLVALVALHVLLGIERDEILSSVAGTTPGAITPSTGLMTRLIGYVVVPISGLIASRLAHPSTIFDILKGIANGISK